MSIYSVPASLAGVSWLGDKPPASVLQPVPPARRRQPPARPTRQPRPTVDLADDDSLEQILADARAIARAEDAALEAAATREIAAINY